MFPIFHTMRTSRMAGCHSDVRLISARTAKRWGRWFVFAWIGMWLGTALLPCCEVEAAAAAVQQAQHADCGHGGDQAPGTGDGGKSGACLGISAPAPASPERLVSSIGGGLFQPALSSAPFHWLSSLPASTVPAAYRAAPPPPAVYLRSSRLLI